MCDDSLCVKDKVDVFGLKPGESPIIPGFLGRPAVRSTLRLTWETERRRRTLDG
jgi:hypothetical protein